MTGNHHHTHEISIDPRELSAGSVLVSIDVGDQFSARVATRRGTLEVKPHDGASNAAAVISPIEHVLVGLALSTVQALKMAISLRQLEVSKFFVAVSQVRESDEISLTREIVVEDAIDDDARSVLADYAERCAVSGFLSGRHVITTLVVK